MELEQLNTRIPKELKKELKKIALREDKDLEDVITEQLLKFAKEHGDGNPVYSLEKWVDEPNFKAIPALMTTFDKWNDFMEKCSKSELKDLNDYSGHVYFKSGVLLKK